MLHSKTTLALVACAFAITAYAQDSGTLKKIKDSGTIVLGTRESSGALAYTLGDGKYVGFHTEMGEHIARDIGELEIVARVRRLPVARQIGRDDTEARQRLIEHMLPVVTRSCEAMKKQQRLAVAGIPAKHRHAVDCG